MTYSGISIVVVGGVFLFSGIVKSLNSGAFFHHLDQLKLFSPRLNTAIGFLLIELESGLGAALMTGIFRRESLYFAAGLLILFSIITAKNLKTSQTKRCGCYGELINISPLQSLLINLLLLVCIAFVGTTPAQDASMSFWHLALLFFVIGASGFLAKQSVQKPIFDPSPLKSGTVWQKNWLKEPFDFNKQELALLVCVAQTGPKFREWGPVLESLHQDAWKHHIYLIVPDSLREIEILNLDDNGAGIPLLPMESETFARLIRKSPLGMILKSGVIQRTWHVDFPIEILELTRLDRFV